MRGFASIFVFLIFAFGALEDSMAVMRAHNITIPSMRFTAPSGQTYRVRSGSLRTNCNRTYCYFRAAGHRLRVSRSQVQIHNEERNINPTYFTPNRHTGGELGGSSADQRNYVGRYTTGSGASEHLSCYQRLRDNYTSRYCPDRRSLPSIRGCSGMGTKRRTDSLGWCARYVRFILNDCGVLPENSIARLAENAGPALERQGFRRLSTLSPDRAPLGSIIVYSGTCPARPRNADPGHIEIKTGPSEYTSDYVGTAARSTQTSCRRVTGIYFK